MEYLRTEKGCLKIGVHGQSMGGAVAAHLSKSQGVEFVLADWTFMSLNSMVKQMHGKYLWFGYQIATFGQWGMDIVEKYVYSNCYKVVACDARDELVVEAGSLKIGIQELIIKRET